MNTKRAGRFISTLLMVWTCWLAASATADVVVVGRDGQVLLCYSGNGTSLVTSAVSGMPNKRTIVESFFEPSEKRLFVSDDIGNLLELDFCALSNGYKRVDTGVDLVDCSVWYDAKEKAPAWLHLQDGTSGSSVRFRKDHDVSGQSLPSDITFQGGFVFGMHIDGLQSSTSFSTIHAALAFLTHKYPNGRWIMAGRSDKLEVYCRILVDTTKSGEQFKSTMLFHDRQNNGWRMEELEEAGEVIVHGDVAVIKGCYLVKDAVDPKTGCCTQPVPTGTWYFYDRKQAKLTKRKLDPGLTVKYATPENALLSRDGEILTLNLHDENSRPTPLVIIPVDTIVVAVLPYD